MSPVQDVSPEILIHRQGTVIGFNQPTVPGQVQAECHGTGLHTLHPCPGSRPPRQVSDNHAVTVATQTEAPHFPGAGVNITDRGDLP
ncbi:Uncharacterised protein [Escherichia coli]|uniref:Uncharacterized protein n=1 Tax=Escherichia coli TaxID=562 RepID=A0A376K3S5_ECOLX|nr:Uncharacterised protein [Escherichia coli]